MLVLEERWKDSAQAQVLSNKALEEGKIAAWCMGSGQLLERHSLQNSNHHSGGGVMSRPFLQQTHVRECNTGIFKL